MAVGADFTYFVKVLPAWVPSPELRNPRYVGVPFVTVLPVCIATVPAAFRIATRQFEAVPLKYV
jgi:hypothetical protein